MSTRKDKFSSKDNFYMELALELARAREGHTGTNPSVGCVIVKNNKIISIGQTSFNGRPHAESNAIENAFEDLKGGKVSGGGLGGRNTWIQREILKQNGLDPDNDVEIVPMKGGSDGRMGVLKSHVLVVVELIFL